MSALDEPMKAIDRLIAEKCGLITEKVDAIARAEKAEESLHYCNGVADLAIKHRDIAEAGLVVMSGALAALQEAAIAREGGGANIPLSIYTQVADALDGGQADG